jgi:hypothetical protein
VAVSGYRLACGPLVLGASSYAPRVKKFNQRIGPQSRCPRWYQSRLTAFALSHIPLQHHTSSSYMSTASSLLSVLHLPTSGPDGAHSRREPSGCQASTRLGVLVGTLHGTVTNTTVASMQPCVMQKPHTTSTIHDDQSPSVPAITQVATAFGWPQSPNGAAASKREHAL